jgi:hypothetical protein
MFCGRFTVKKDGSNTGGQNNPNANNVIIRPYVRSISDLDNNTGLFHAITYWPINVALRQDGDADQVLHFSPNVLHDPPDLPRKG